MVPPDIVTIGTGGTISEDTQDGPGLGVASISATAGELDAIAVPRAVEFSRVPGRAIQPEQMLGLARLVVEQTRQGCDGVVITHGTDTMEETAYALAMMLDVPVPVVLTGSMRLPHEPGHDGGANMRAAILAAAHSPLAALGPVVAFQGELHLARWVTKTHTSRVAAFSSPETGPVGVISEDTVLLNHTQRPPDLLAMPATLRATTVELVWAYAGLEPRAVHALAEAADGLVVAGTGGGHTPPEVAHALQRIVASGTPVVLASRCAAGPTLVNTYDGPGGDRQLRAIGVHSAGRLSAIKARLRLQVALALGRDVDRVFPT